VTTEARNLRDVPLNGRTAVSEDELVDAMAWMNGVVIVGDSFRGPTIAYADGTVHATRCPRRPELNED
jgi:hypothetical protein